MNKKIFFYEENFDFYVIIVDYNDFVWLWNTFCWYRCTISPRNLVNIFQKAVYFFTIMCHYYI